MVNKITILILFLSFLLFACNSEKKQQSSVDFIPPEVVEAKAYVVPQDKMAPPEIAPAKEIKSKAISEPKTITLNSNINPAGKPIIVPAGTPKICTPGQDGFALPMIVAAVDSPFKAGIPEVTIAKDPQMKDNDPASFSVFKVLQGLKTNMIFPIIQDRAGNLWIACYEGGVCKYDGRNFTSYRTTQGLSSDNVFSMLQDSKGNLWFGTEGKGLTRFDGKLFTHYSTREGFSSGRITQSILEDSKGNLWFGTDNNGTSKYDGKTFSHYTTKQGLVSDNVRSIIEDSEGNLWFGALGGISKYDGKSFSNYTINEGLSHTEIKCLLQDHNGNLWISTSGGIYKYDGKNFEHYSVEQGMCSNLISEILEDKLGNLLFGTEDKGIIKYDGKSFTQLNTEHGLSGYNIHNLQEDKNGNLWIGTNNGLSRYNGKMFTHFDKHSGFGEGNYNSIHEDKKGNIWLGIIGHGVNKFDGKSVTQYTPAQGLTDDQVLCVVNDKNDNIWISTFNGGLNRFDGKSFSRFENFPEQLDSWNMCMLNDSKGNLWMGSAKGIYKYDGKNFTHFGSAQGLQWKGICYIYEDRKGDLWLGTERDGVVKMDVSNAATGHYSFTHYDINRGNSVSLVYSIMEDKENNLWFGVNGTGVIKYDGKLFTRYTTSQGLSSNGVNSIVQDKKGNLWFLTSNGLCRMKSKGNDIAERTNPDYIPISLFTNYLYTDGFLGVGSHFNSMMLGSDGNIWAGADDHLTCYHPEGDIPDTIPPNIQLTGVQLFDENINWRDIENRKDTTLVLNNGTELKHFNFSGLTPWYNQPENLQLVYNNNYITFQFVGITTNRPKQIRYKYFLEGLDENWSSITDKPEATYSNLPNGTYTFKVKAVNSEGYWSKEMSYSFTINPPWWRTWWAYISYVLIFLVSLWSFIRWRQSALKKEKISLEEKVALRTYELQDEKEKVESTLSELKSTQAQLIESEKMASFNKLQQAMSNERLRISRELHDDIGSTLSGIVLYSHLAEDQVHAEQGDKVKNSLNVIQQSANEMVNRLDDLVWAVNPERNSLKDLVQKLEEYAKEMSMAKNIKVQVNIPGSWDQLQLPVESRHNIYLFGKEAINNAVKYSQASLLELSVHHFDHVIEFIINDNGKGFDMATVKKGNGIINMQKRADEAAAILSIQSFPKQGTTISLQFKITQ